MAPFRAARKSVRVCVDVFVFRVLPHLSLYTLHKLLKLLKEIPSPPKRGKNDIMNESETLNNEDSKSYKDRNIFIHDIYIWRNGDKGATKQAQVEGEN